MASATPYYIGQGLETAFDVWSSVSEPFEPIPDNLLSLAMTWVRPFETDTGSGDWVVWLPFIRVPLGKVYIRQGDWIVTDDGGNKTVMRPQTFPDVFNEVPNDNA